MQINLKAIGFAEAKVLLGRVATAAARVSGPIISLTNTEVYAYGIETGRTRSGRLARKAGGAFMYRDGIAAMQPKIGQEMGPAILLGPGAVDAAKSRLNDEAIKEVQPRTPVVSGRLRAGVVRSGRPG